MPAKKPVPAKKPSLPAAKSTETEDSPPPKPLRKSQSLAKQQLDDAIVSSAPPKPTRPRSTYEPDKCMHVVCMCMCVFVYECIQIYTYMINYLYQEYVIHKCCVLLFTYK